MQREGAVATVGGDVSEVGGRTELIAWSSHLGEYRKATVWGRRAALRALLACRLHTLIKGLARQ